jgi:hypothetical protein
VGKTSSDFGATAGIELNGQYDVGYFTRSGDKPLVVNRLTSDGSITDFRKNGTTVGSIGTVNGDLLVGTGDTGLRFHDTDNRIYPINTSGGTKVDATIDLGDPTGRFKDLYLSGGLRGDTTFKNNAGTTEYARFDSSGNLLVGTTNLNMHTASTGDGVVATSSGRLYVASTENTGASTTVGVFNRISTDGSIVQFKKDGTTVGTIGVTATGVRTYIGNNDSARTAGLSFVDSIAIYPFDSYNRVNTDNTLDLGTSFAKFKDLYLAGAANVGSVVATGNVTAYSDERLKDNIQTLQGSKVLEMRGVSFTKDGEASSGVIAQEIEKVAPELVHTAKDEMGTKSVAYGNLVGYLIEAIKDQQQQIDELKARLDNDSSK